MYVITQNKMNLDDYFYLSKKYGCKYVTPVILIGINAQSKYGLTHKETLLYTDAYLHQENCGDVKVNRENEKNEV